MSNFKNTISVATGCLIFLSIIYSGCKTKDLPVYPSVINQNIKEDVRILASDSMEGRETGRKGEKKAADYISSRMNRIGLSQLNGNSYYQTFSKTVKANPHQEEASSEDEILVGTNVIGIIDNKSKYNIIIGAHYDHLGFGGEGSLSAGEHAIHNGADDNASGISTMLSLAERFVQNNHIENHNIIFMGFSGEEKGLWGSNSFVKSNLEVCDMTSFMINMDMVGRLNEERKLAINGVGTSPVFVPSLEKLNQYGFHLVTSESGIGPSDHTSFYLDSIPVLHFFTGQHEDYHKPSDDFDKINFEGMADISDYIYNIVMDLDMDNKVHFNKTKDESTETPRFVVGLGVVPDYLYDGKGMRVDGVREDKPAFVAEIKKGDIVVKMGEIDVVDMMTYMKALSQFKKGDITIVVVTRDGKEIKKEVQF